MLTRNVRWDVTADVVVVGHGCAGPVAAVTAREAGAEVLILEKQPQKSHHTNTSMSGGVILCPSDVKSGEEYLDYLVQAGNGACWTEKDMVRTWAEYTATNKAWFEARGGAFVDTPLAAEYPGKPGHGAMLRHRFRGSGPAFARLLGEMVKNSNVPVMYGTRATQLLTDGAGRVVGVRAENGEVGGQKTMHIRASKGVVMAPGGFEFDEQMKLTYLKIHPTYFTGAEANTGDGVKMAMAAGADLWHMNCVSAHTVMKFPGYPIAFYPVFVPFSGFVAHPGAIKDLARQCGYLVVDRAGSRFLNEDNLRETPPRHAYYYELALYDSQRLTYPRVPTYWVFDRRRIELGPLASRTVGPTGPSRVYEWSSDSSRELAAGWIASAPTVGALAGLLELPPDALEGTVARYNRSCEQQKDIDFGRNPVDLIPLEQPPYCAVRLWPGGANTQGGPRRNIRAEVLAPDGQPIPGLYSAGEMGSVYGMLYPGGGNLAEAVASGRIAGENVVRQKPG